MFYGEQVVLAWRLQCQLGNGLSIYHPNFPQNLRPSVLSVPKFYRKSVLYLRKYTENLYLADAVQICDKSWDTQYLSIILYALPIL